MHENNICLCILKLKLDLLTEDLLLPCNCLMHKTFSVKIESLDNNIFSSQGSSLFILFSPLANITKFVMPSSSLSELSHDQECQMSLSNCLSCIHEKENSTGHCHNCEQSKLKEQIDRMP